jgi:DHA1 family tetracycline resistance protein-like MFS transporter
LNIASTDGALRATAAMPFILVTAVLDIVAMGIVIPVLPRLIEQFVGSNAQAGVINGAFVALWALMQFIASPVIGSLSDRFGRRPVILISAAGLGVNYFIMALAPNLAWLLVGRLVSGVTSASFTTVIAYIADVTAPEKRARAYGFIGAAYSAGFIAGPLLGGLLGELSPRAPFYAAGALSALACGYGAFVLPESLAPERRMAFSWKRASPSGALRLLRSHRELFGLAIVNFLVAFANYVFAAVFVLYAHHRYGWGPWEVGVLLAIVGLLDVIVQSMLVGPMTGRLGNRGAMVFGIVAGASGFICMGLAPTAWWFAIALVPNALAGLANPTLQALMTPRVSESEQGQLQGANMSLSSVAGVLAPAFFGVIYSASLSRFAGREGFAGVAFLVAALVLLIAAGVGWRGGKR